MKKNMFLFIFGLSFLLVETALAQKPTKAEQKALKKELKEMQKNPAKYKQLKESIQEKKEQLAKLDGDIADLNETINNTQQQINEKDKRLKELSDELARMNVEKRETDNAIKTQTNEQGLVYKVQIPIDDSALYQEVSEIDGQKRPVFSGDTDTDGTKKYTLGYFKDKKEAETFRNYLQMLRIKDAKVVTYKDGKKAQ
jgi:DNA repair exonuclease SbcCD ATPase subunit